MPHHSDPAAKKRILARVRAYHNQPRYTPPRQAPNSGTSSNTKPSTVKTSRSTYSNNNNRNRNPYGIHDRTVTVTPREKATYTVTSTYSGRQYTANTRAEAIRLESQDTERLKREAREREARERAERERAEREARERAERERLQREADERRRIEAKRIQDENIIRRQLAQGGVKGDPATLLAAQKTNPNAVTQYINYKQSENALAEYTKQNKENWQRYNSELQSAITRYDAQSFQYYQDRRKNPPTHPTLSLYSGVIESALRERKKIQEKIKKNPLDYSSRYDYGLEKKYNIVRDTASSFLQPFHSIALTGKNIIDSTFYGGKDQYHIRPGGIGMLIEGLSKDIMSGKAWEFKFKSTEKAWDDVQKYYTKNPNRLVGEIAGEIALGVLTAGTGTLLTKGLKAVSPISRGVVQLPDGSKLGNVLVRKSTGDILATYKGVGIRGENKLGFLSRGLDTEKLNLKKLADYKPTRGGGEIDHAGVGGAVWSRDETLTTLKKSGILSAEGVERTKATRDMWKAIASEPNLKQQSSEAIIKGTTRDQSQALWQSVKKGQRQGSIDAIHGSTITKSNLSQKVIDDTVPISSGDIDAPLRITKWQQWTGQTTKIKDKTITQTAEALKSASPDQEIVVKGLGTKGNRGIEIDGIKKFELIDKDKKYAGGGKQTGSYMGSPLSYRTKQYDFLGNKIKGISSRTQLAENLKQATSLNPNLKGAGKFTKQPDPGRDKDIVRSWQTASQYAERNPAIRPLVDRFKKAYSDTIDDAIKKSKETAPRKTTREVVFETKSEMASRITKTGSSSIITGGGSKVPKIPGGSNLGGSRLPPGKNRSIIGSPPPPAPSNIPIPNRPIRSAPKRSVISDIRTIRRPAMPIYSQPGQEQKKNQPGSAPPSGDSDPSIIPIETPPPSTPPPYEPPIYPSTPPPPPGRPSIIPTTGDTTIIPGGGTGKRPPPVIPFWREEESKRKTKKKSSKKIKGFVGNTYKDYAFGFTGDREITYGRTQKQLKQKSIRDIGRKPRRKKITQKSISKSIRI